MANLKILGAQRVKALTEMLKEQEAAAIAEIQKEQLSYEKAKDVINAKLGVKEYCDEINSMKKRIEELNELIQAKTGGYFHISENYQYGNVRNKYNDMIDKARKNDTDKQIAEVKAEFKRKEQRLWLCETLEEAKAIVGI